MSSVDRAYGEGIYRVKFKMGVSTVMEIKEFMNGLIYRPAPEVFDERKIATASFDKSDMNTLVKLRMYCNSCPRTGFDQAGLCLSGFMQDQIFYDTIRCNYLGSISNELFSKDNLKVIIQCEWNNRKDNYNRL